MIGILLRPSTMVSKQRAILVTVSYDSYLFNFIVIDAIVVGVEHLQRNATKRDVEKHIILLSNLEGATDTRQLSECIERLRRSNTNLDVLGVNMPTKKGAKQEDEDTPGPSNRKAFSEKMRARLAVFSEILEAVNGRSFTFE